LAGEGAKVAIFDLGGDADGEGAAKIRAEGYTAIGLPVDVSARPAIEAAVADVRTRWGPVTTLVNNAGMEGFQPFLKITTETWNRLLAVNLTGTFHCCQIVLPDMIDAGWGRI